MAAEVRDRAYVCLGSCAAAVTSPRQCGDRQCTLFGQTLREVQVVYSCSTGNCEDSIVPSLHDAHDCPKHDGRQRKIAMAVVPIALLGNNATADEHREVIDVNQLPAKVRLTFIPGGNPPPPAQARPVGPMGVLHVPTGECEWEGRRMQWRVVKFNNKSNDQGERVFATIPGRRCYIRVAFETRWRFNRHDYCPGCVVQLYFGMDSVFSRGVIERGIRNDHGHSQVEFNAPMVPGLYYITQAISLDYHYVNVHHHNNPHNAIAAIRVLPTEFDASTFDLLPRHIQDNILAIMCFHRREGGNATVFSRLSRFMLFALFSYLIDPDENLTQQS